MHVGSTAADEPAGARLVVDVPSLHDAEGLGRQLLAVAARSGGDGSWLRARYAELVPQLLPSLLTCLRTGDPIPEQARAAVARSARAQRGSTVPYATVLRGGGPALACFARFVHDGDPRPGATETGVLLARAALIAQELGAHWVENWRGVQPPGVPGADCGDDPGDDRLPAPIVAQPGTLTSPVLEMVRMVAEGRSNEQIAARTAYSPQAVKWHLARLMRDWGVGNRAALVTGAFSRGVLRVPRSD